MNKAQLLGSNISLESLRVFCKAAISLNFSVLAQEIGASPAYVSKRIQLLESDLGVKLFHRSTRQVTLTEQGEYVFGLAQQIVESVDHLHDQIDLMRNEPSGTLLVSTSFGFGRQVVANCLADFAKHYPSVRIRLRVMDRLVDLVKEKFDLDIRIGDTIDPNYIARKLANNYRVLCASPLYLTKHGAPENIAELASHSCVVIQERDHPLGLWRLSDGKNTASIHVEGGLSTNNGEIALAWALQGHGVLLRSVWDVQAYLREGSLVRILPPWRQDANIWAVYPERMGASAKITTLVRYMENYFQQWESELGLGSLEP